MWKLIVIRTDGLTTYDNNETACRYAYTIAMESSLTLFAGFSFNAKDLAKSDLETISKCYLNNVAYQDCAKRIIH